MNIKRKEQLQEVLTWYCKEILVVNAELRKRIDEFQNYAETKELHLLCADEFRAFVHLLTTNYIFDKYKYVHISNGRFVFGVNHDGKMDLLFSSKLHQPDWLK